MTTSAKHNSSLDLHIPHLQMANEDPSHAKFDKQLSVFQQLPTELRLMVWKFALPNGRRNDGKRVFPLEV